MFEMHISAVGYSAAFLLVKTHNGDVEGDIKIDQVKYTHGKL
jgi:hypothetical protein